jgi:hypothetical protein
MQQVQVLVVNPVVTCKTSDWFLGAVTESEVRTRVEVRLRNAGVTVVDSVGEAKALFGVLDVNVLALAVDRESMTFAVNAEEEFRRPLLSMKDGRPEKVFMASTWSTGVIVRSGMAGITNGSLMATLDSLTDEFLNVWLAAHPKH